MEVFAQITNCAVLATDFGLLVRDSFRGNIIQDHGLLRVDAMRVIEDCVNWVYVLRQASDRSIRVPTRSIRVPARSHRCRDRPQKNQN